ncbi:MAG: helix-turn-helix transcriptional regulator [Magnetococcales bacterium]|nr:helix-turn-helix transcriptional regulator [Magnetococcales bacterium]
MKKTGHDQPWTVLERYYRTDRPLNDNRTDPKKKQLHPPSEEMPGVYAAEEPLIVQETIRQYPVIGGMVLSDIESEARHGAQKVFELAYKNTPRLLLRVMVSGQDVMRSASHPKGLILEKDRCGFFSEPELLTTMELSPGTTRHLNLCIAQSGLQELIGDTPLPTPLQAFLEGRKPAIAWDHAASPAMQRIAMEVRNVQYDGHLQRLFMQCKSLELFLELVQLFGRDGYRAESLSVREQRVLLEARDLLLDHISAPPSLDELARQLGSTPKKINMAFRQNYGMTLFQWLSDWKLTHARDLLVQGDHSIKEIAFDLGYQHVNNFTLAFSRRFGAPPARFRRDLSAPTPDLP